MTLERELALRQHIRNLLLGYSLTHLTTNYVTFTQDAVAELLSSSLVTVPTVDPNTLVLPPEPFDVLSNRLGLQNLGSYEERWIARSEGPKHIKQTLTFPKKSASESCWLEEEEFDYFTSIHRPVSPILTMRAIRQTPDLGSSTHLAGLPISQSDLIESYSVKFAEEEVLEDEPRISLEDALLLKPAFDASTRASMMQLFNSIPSLSGPRDVDKEYESLPVGTFLQEVSPPPTPRIRYDSPPIFPRARRLGAASKEGRRPSVLGLETISNLRSMIPEVKIENEEDDIFRQHMKVVDGWNVYVSSPQSSLGTPSFGDGTSEVDELFLPSPPDQNEAPIRALMSAKMDDIELPRAKKRGGDNTRPKGIGEGQNLASFLSPLLLAPAPTPPSQPMIVSMPKSQPSSPLTSMTISMLGQASYSAITDCDGKRRRMNQEDTEDRTSLHSDDFDHAVGKLYEEFRGRDPKELIMNVKLDEKETLLMDVPTMPPPNAHDPNHLMPASLRSLVAPSLKNKIENTVVSKNSTLGFLRKTKGIQSLNLELSWRYVHASGPHVSYPNHGDGVQIESWYVRRPFKFGHKVPTNEEVVGVSRNIDEDFADFAQSTGECVKAEDNIHRILGVVTGRDADGKDLRSWNESVAGSPTRVTSNVADVLGGLETLMTREDRQRSARLSRDEMEGSDDPHRPSHDHREQFALIDRDRSDSELDSPPRKKARQQSPDSCNVFANHGSGLSGPIFFDPHWTDDSGVALMEQIGNGNHHDAERLHYEEEAIQSLDGSPFRPLDLGEDVFQFSDVYNDDNAPDSLNLDFAAEDLRSWIRRPVENPTKEYERLPSPQIPAKCSRNDRTSAYGLEARIVSPHDAVIASSPATGTVVCDDTVERVLFEARLGRSPMATSQNQSGKFSDLPKFGSLELSSARQSLMEFMRLRSKQISVAELSLSPRSSKHSSNEEPIAAELPSPCRTIPTKLFDRNTLIFPSVWHPPTTRHRYMASIDLIQKRNLVCCLESDYCAVQLVERNSLGDADLILDPNTCVIIASVLSLPGQCETVTARLGVLSWRFAHLLVVFEAFPASLAYSYGERVPSGLEPNAFSPPILKAIKKLRRDLDLSEVYHKKCSASTIHFAFANSVDEAAIFVRMFGDSIEGTAKPDDAIWGDRSWLDADEQEGEHDLACIDGMNAFCAALILSHATLDEFLEAHPQERMQFSDLIGFDRMVQFNGVIGRRSQAIKNFNTPPPLTGCADMYVDDREWPRCKTMEQHDE